MASFDLLNNNPDIKKEVLLVVRKRSGHENVELSVDSSRFVDHFMSDIYRIQLNHLQKRKISPESLIVKMAPRNLERRHNTNTQALFARETFVYDKILPIFNDIQLSKGINPNENGFNECASCYSIINEELSETLFLEDLKLRNFELIDLRKEPLTFEHMSLVMEALGKLHAISFALKDQQPEQFKVLVNELDEIYWCNMTVRFKAMFKKMLEGFLFHLEEENRFDLIEKIKGIIGDDVEAAAHKFILGSSAEPYSVICHGDVTTNNSMFRKDDKGNPVEFRLLDWQFSRYASPVTEIVIYILCSTTKELRDKHYEDFLKIYHESLTDLLSRLGSDAQKLFPYDALLSQFQEYGAFAAIVAVLIIPIIFSERGTLVNAMTMPNTDGVLTHSKLYFVSEEHKTLYNKTIIDLLDDMMLFGYF